MKPKIKSELKSIVHDTIAVHALPREYKEGIKHMLDALTVYVQKHYRAPMPYKIETLYYMREEIDWYSVNGITDEDKFCIEGYVCYGILKQLIAQTKKDGGKVMRVKTKL